MNSAESLLDRSTEKMEAAYSFASQNGLQDPIVLVLDVRDSDAKWAATLVSDDDAQVQAALDHSAKNQTIPSLVTAASRNNAEIIADRLDEGLSRWLKQAATPDDQFIAICITDGRVACRAFQKP